MVDKLYKWSDQFPRDTFRYWLSHCLYNFVKDIYQLRNVSKF
jgi:hypothetical protein